MAIADNLQYGGGTGVSVNAPDSTVRRKLNLALNELGAAIASDDKIYFDKAPAGSKVVFHRVANSDALTLGTSAAIYVGDTSVTSRFVSNSALNTAGAVHSLVTGANTTGQVYESATDLCITLIRSTGSSISGNIDLVYDIIDMTAVAGPKSF